jgi:putative membrane protein
MMTVHFKHVALAMSLAFAWAGVAAVAASPAQATKDSAATTKSKTDTKTETKMNDSDFAKAAAEGGLAEVKLGQLAEDKASEKSVKDLGQRMVDDHTKANDDLKTAAAKDNVSSLPSQMDKKDQTEYDRLSKLSGTQFDRAYTEELVKDHKSDIAMFRHEAQDGKDPAIKSFAAKTLPTLESHLTDAEQTLHAVSSRTSSKTTGKHS